MKELNDIKIEATLYGFISENAGKFADNYAIDYFGNRIKYKELFLMINKIAASLNANGIGPGDRIALSLITTPESIALIYACSLIGAEMVLLDVRYTVKEIAKICSEADVKMLFIMDWYRKDLNHMSESYLSIKTVCVSPVESLNAFVRFGRGIGQLFYNKSISDRSNLINWRRFLDPDEKSTGFGSAYYQQKTDKKIYFPTSGTTGKIKMVELSEKKLNLAAYQHRFETLDLNSNNSILSVIPIFSCYGFVISVHLPLSLGMELIIYPIFNYKKIPKIIADKKPNYITGVPAFTDIMMGSKYLNDTDLSFIKAVISGGEGISEDKTEEFNAFLSRHNSSARLRQGYGMTELSGGCFFQSDEDYTPGTVGKPVGYARAKITDSGEICVHTPCMMSGYLNDTQGTSEIMKLHDDGRLWIHTGDIGTMDKHGNLTVLGRFKNMFVSGNGTKVFPETIERNILNFNFINDCAVVPVKNSNGEYVDKIVIFIVIDKQNVSVNAAKKYIRNNLKAEKFGFVTNCDIMVINKIPLTGSGKHNYQQLCEMIS